MNQRSNQMNEENEYQSDRYGQQNQENRADDENRNIIEILVKGVKEEKYCPFLLPYKADLIQSFIKVISQQESN